MHRDDYELRSSRITAKTLAAVRTVLIYVEPMHAYYKTRIQDEAHLEYVPASLISYGKCLYSLIAATHLKATAAQQVDAPDVELHSQNPLDQSPHYARRSFAPDLLPNTLAESLFRELVIEDAPNSESHTLLTKEDYFLLIQRYAALLVTSLAEIVRLNARHYLREGQIRWSHRRAEQLELMIDRVEESCDAALLLLDAEREFQIYAALDLLCNVETTLNALKQGLPQLFLTRAEWTSNSRQAEQCLTALMQDCQFWLANASPLFDHCCTFVNFYEDDG